MDDDTLGDLEIISENATGLAVKVNGNISNGILNQMKIKGDIDFENKKILSQNINQHRSGPIVEDVLAGPCADQSDILRHKQGMAIGRGGAGAESCPVGPT